MRKANTRVLQGFSALLAGFMAVSCVDEKVVERIVEVEREIFQEPAEAALGMLGYSSQESKLTACGNCHIGPQKQWEATDHAGAWETLQNSGHASDSCAKCHTVNQLGNVHHHWAGS